MSSSLSGKVALVTGGSRRVGREIVQALHSERVDVVIHYNQSQEPAEKLAQALNETRPNSALSLPAQLGDINSLRLLASQAEAWKGGVDLLVNNASSFYPTPLSDLSEDDWQNLFDSNLKGPTFLSQALETTLNKRHGSIINIVDIYSERPLKNHSLYCMAKAGNAMMVKALALELAPNVRVNGVSPGAILWPENQPPSDQQIQSLLGKVPLARKGEPSDIAQAVLFLAGSPYTTGQVLAVDGGRSLNT